MTGPGPGPAEHLPPHAGQAVPSCCRQMMQLVQDWRYFAHFCATHWPQAMVVANESCAWSHVSTGLISASSSLASATVESYSGPIATTSTTAASVPPPPLEEEHAAKRAATANVIATAIVCTVTSPQKPRSRSMSKVIHDGQPWRFCECRACEHVWCAWKREGPGPRGSARSIDGHRQEVEVVLCPELGDALAEDVLEMSMSPEASERRAKNVLKRRPARWRPPASGAALVRRDGAPVRRFE
jgi:hypothetical protein